jgi:hypothetical protein
MNYVCDECGKCCVVIYPSKSVERRIKAQRGNKAYKETFAGQCSHGHVADGTCPDCEKEHDLPDALKTALDGLAKKIRGQDEAKDAEIAELKAEVERLNKLYDLYEPPEQECGGCHKVKSRDEFDLPRKNKELKPFCRMCWSEGNQRVMGNYDE